MPRPERLYPIRRLVLAMHQAVFDRIVFLQKALVYDSMTEIVRRAVGLLYEVYRLKKENKKIGYLDDDGKFQEIIIVH